MDRQNTWITGCTKHTIEVTQKATGLVIRSSAAISKAQDYCKCEWDYMTNDIGLDIEEVVSIGDQDLRGSSIILEAQNVWYETDTAGIH